MYACVGGGGRGGGGHSVPKNSTAIHMQCFQSSIACFKSFRQNCSIFSPCMLYKGTSQVPVPLLLKRIPKTMLTMTTVTRGKTHPMAKISTNPDCVGSVTPVLSGTSRITSVVCMVITKSNKDMLFVKLVLEKRVLCLSRS